MPALAQLGRGLRAIVATVALAVVFVLAAAGGLILHLDLAPLRRAVAARVQAALAPVLRGTLRIESVGRLGLDGIDEGNVLVFDPAGAEVGALYGVRARIDLRGIVRSALSGTGPIVIDLAQVTVRAADFDADVDADGLLGVQRAFASRAPSSPSSGGGRGVRFGIRHIVIDHAWIHGSPVSGLLVDADVDSLAGSVLIDSPHVNVDADHFKLTTRSMPLHADALGTVEAHLAIPAPSGGTLRASVAWAGAIAGIDESARGSIDGDAIDVAIDAPRISPDAVRALWPASPISEPADAHVDVHGSLPRLEVHAHSTLAEASVDVTGPIVLGPDQVADLHLDARAIDIHSFAASAPTSKLGATGDLAVSRSANGAISGKATIAFAGGHIGGETIPAGRIRGTFSDDAVKGKRAEATVAAHEPGAPTFLSLQLLPKGKSYELTFEANTHVAALDAIPRLGSVARGRSELKTRGAIDFSRGALDVKLEAEVDDLGHDVMNVKHASVRARVRGSLRSPQIDVSVQGNLLDFGGYRFSGAEIEVHGPASKATIHVSLDADGDGTPDFEAGGELSLGSVTTIDQIKVRIAREGERIHVHVGSVRIAGGEIAIDPIDIDGLGGPIHGSFHSSFRAAHLQVAGEGIDIARLGRVSRFQEGLSGCLLSLDVDLDARNDGADGHATFELAKCSVGKLEGLSAGLQATMQERRVVGRAHGELEGVGSLVLSTAGIEIGGKGSVLEEWRQAWGRVQFDGKLDLAKLAAHLPRASLPFDQVQGVISLRGRIQRDSPTDDTPGFTLSASTEGLALVGASKRTTGLDGTAVIAPPAWRVEGIDLGLDARIDGDSGFASLAVRLNDVNGQLAALDLKSGAVPYVAILDAPSRALSLLETVPFNARVVVPPRDIKALPAVLALSGVRGELRADVSATGTVLLPTVDVTASLTRLRVSHELAFPIDLALTGHYDGAHAEMALAGTAKGAQVIDAHVTLDARMPALLAERTGDWTASGRAHLDSLQLESIAALSDRQVTGIVSGDVTLDGLHQDARSSLSLDLTGLKVGEVTYPAGTLRATLDGKALDAAVHLAQSDGSIDAKVNAGTKWGAALTPRLDPSRPLNGQLDAKNLRAALFLPFVDNTFTELDGRVDAAMQTTIEPSTGSAKTQGTLSLTKGRFELAAMGGEFHDVTGKATFTPDGVVKLQGLQAQGMSGRVEAAASARLNGLALVAANATVQVPSSAPLLLTVEGSQVGTVVGTMNVSLAANPTAIKVKVAVPTLHVELPLTSSRDVQQLGEMDGVTIGVEKRGGAFVAQRLDAPKDQVAAPSGKTVEVAIELGKDVEVKKSNQLKVAITGNPTIVVGNDVRATGQIRLLSGTIDVQGKSFNIESGTITFQGDPSDPQVVVTASWTASDGTRVYAEMRGTLKSPKVTLRSEPSFSQNEIIALLVYGSADAANPSSSQSTAGTPQTSAAAGVAGGAATQPLNRALENLGLGGVSTRVDTSSTTPRADVEVQIARDISFQIAQVMGTPPPGSNPDVTLFTLNWRFIRAWSAETTIGNAGTSILDLIWQYRY